MIKAFLEELTAAEQYELARIHGYDELLAIPQSLLSDEARDEVREALAWSLDRQKKIAQAIEVIKALTAHDYPARIQQIASQTAIKELKDRLEAMRLAVAEFDIAPMGTAQISEEIPVNP